MPDDVKPSAPKTTPKRAKVVDAMNPNRVLFEGTEDDARDFVETQAPRTTSVDGVATAAVHLDTGGAKEFYAGPEDSDPWRTVEA